VQVHAEYTTAADAAASDDDNSKVIFCYLVLVLKYFFVLIFVFCSHVITAQCTRVIIIYQQSAIATQQYSSQTEFSKSTNSRLRISTSLLKIRTVHCEVFSFL